MFLLPKIRSFNKKLSIASFLYQQENDFIKVNIFRKTAVKERRKLEKKI
jgi:hypothetical protein